MGQSQSTQSAAPRSREELTNALAQKFADKCFTSLEFYSLKDVFKSLADSEQDVRYLKEDTIARFLEIPDILHASPVVFQMVSYIGAFPFLREAPAVLGLEQMIMVVTIMTDRYRRVLAKGAADRRKLIFKSLAVYDRKLSEMSLDNKKTDGGPEADSGAQDSSQVTQGTHGQGDSAATTRSHHPGFAIDQAVDDDEDDDLAIEMDELVMAAFESIDYVDVFKHGDGPTVHGAMIPADNFRKLIMLLLLIAPLGAQESLASYSYRVVGDELENLRATAESILASFLNVEKSPGIKFTTFNSIIPICFPYMFHGFNALFEHFLFSKNLDLNKHKDGAQPMPANPPQLVSQPLLQDTGSIMNLNVLSQLSFFIKGDSLFRRLRLLYSGENDGFSMGSFETKVFNWRAPTILLVRGSRLPYNPNSRAGGPASTFTSSLPAKRFPDGSKNKSGDDDDEPETLTYGVYVGQPWKHTHRECFGDENTILFQLEPVHDVFPASRVNKDYVSFIKPTSSSSGANTGLTFGCPPPGGSSTPIRRATSMATLGPLSLLVDNSFEFGCFTHDWTARGGAFQTSVVRRFDFQDRFEVESLEVWGCGGDDEAKHQADRWAWEAREAEARRRINLGTRDIEADRALLEMAGLIGANRSGGSMG